MRIRDQRWTVAEVIPHRDATVVVVIGCDRWNRGDRARYLLPFERFDRLPAVAAGQVVSPRRWRHLATATLAHATRSIDSLRAAASADINILPYQLEPALAVVRGNASRVLIADDPGLGKTIQAGVIIAETLARRTDAHVLVVCPAGLREQWHAELTNRFHLDPTVFDAAALRRQPVIADANPWAVHPLILTSADYIKRPEVIRALEPLVWDLLVVDEAHCIAGDSDRHTAAILLSQRSRVVVLLSATPHSGDEAAFKRLIAVGDLRARFPLTVFRRTRADVALPDNRRTRWLRVRPTAAEVRMHRALMAYVRRVWARPASAGARLAMIVLTRRASSSAGALARTVERRLTLLHTASGEESQLALPLHLGSDDDEPGVEIGAPGLEDGAAERQALESVAVLARQAAAAESKPRCLARLLRRCGESAIVFTEYRDTLASLQRELSGFDTCQLHGGLTSSDRSDVVRAFVSGRSRILLATDAASEGLNLQARCRLVIHLEVPWSPTRIEQRVGRVDRIGQTRRVHNVHLVAAQTIEESRVARLAQRMSRITSTLREFAVDETDAAADYVIAGKPCPALATRTPQRRLSSHSRLRDLAVAEAADISTQRRLRWQTGESAEPGRIRPFLTRRRRRGSPIALGAFWLEYTDVDGQLLWEALVGVQASHSWQTPASRAELRRYVEAYWIGSESAVAAEHRRVASHLCHVAQASTTLALARETAIARDIQERHARMAADLMQPGLFDRRTERAAAAQRELIEQALARCQDRTAELQRRRNVVAATVRPAFALLTW